jgi:SOS-response transcriptional repressor LexA
MAIKDNIKKYRVAQKLNQPELANLCGWDSQSRISNYELGTRIPKIADLEKIAKALNIDVADLISEEVSTPLRLVVNQTRSQYASESLNYVPLISWVQAGAYSECIDDIGECEMIATDLKIKNHTFALKVQGDSMEPIFIDGMIVIVEPDMQAVNGHYVIAKNGDNEATLKQLMQDGSD